MTGESSERGPYEDFPVLEEPRSSWRTVGVWALGVLLALDVVLLLFALSFNHVTAEGPAKRGLRQAVAVLTEVDAHLDEHYDTLRQEAEAQPDRRVTVPDFPIDVGFTSEEVLAGGREEFRALLLDRSADRVYDEGMDAFLEERTGDSADLSAQGAVRNGMDLLRARPHDVLVVATIALAAAAGVLALGLLLASRSYGGLVGLGVAVFVAALPFLIAAVAVRFAFRLAADGVDDSLVEGYLKLGQELTWAPIRNGIIFSVGAAAFITVGASLARWSRSSERPV